ncbi:MAG: hypothetical protein LBC44_00940 [Mycoplasmataceae bacterium]|jgi:hypothetical protein|nr:hypothetical protein [Mycoplasmataceae bacterium]
MSKKVRLNSIITTASILTIAASLSTTSCASKQPVDDSEDEQDGTQSPNNEEPTETQGPSTEEPSPESPTGLPTDEPTSGGYGDLDTGNVGLPDPGDDGRGGE